MMMDVASLRAAVQAAPGDVIPVNKDQLFAMCDEIERGHASERDLVNIRTIANFTPKRWAVTQ